MKQMEFNGKEILIGISTNTYEGPICIRKGSSTTKFLQKKKKLKPISTQKLTNNFPGLYYS